MLLQPISKPQNREIKCDDSLSAVGYGRRTPFPPRGVPFSDDASLVERLRAGDAEAYEQMVRKFGGPLLATARRYLRSEDDACDALQDAFLSAFRSMGTFRGDSRLSTWLHRILINSALMHLRAMRHRLEKTPVKIDDWLPRFDSAGNWANEAGCTTPAHDSLEVAETRSSVRRCIDKLPEAYRVVLILREIDELATEEVASLLGLTTNNVKVRLHRARHGLKALLEREKALL